MQWVGDTFEDSLLVRKKYIHSVGDVAKVSFVPVSNEEGYTGIFEGAEYGYIRMSCAKEPTTDKPAAGNFIPGIGLKFLRDGVHSADLVAMYSVNGQENWNFFSNNFTNHIGAASGVALTALSHKFATATPYVQTVGLSDYAQYNEDGEQISTPNFPWELTFQPSDEVNTMFPTSADYSGTYYTDQLKTIPVGTTVYNLLAKSSPTSKNVHIGDLVLQTTPTTSYWGDKYMFFKHTDM